MEKLKKRRVSAMLMTFAFVALCLLTPAQTVKAEEQVKIEISYIYVNNAGENSIYKDTQYVSAGTTWGDFFNSYGTPYEDGRITDADKNNQWTRYLGNMRYEDSFDSGLIANWSSLDYTYITFRGVPDTHKNAHFTFEYYENGKCTDAGQGWDFLIPKEYAYGSAEALAFVERNMYIYDWLAGYCRKAGAVVSVTPMIDGSTFGGWDGYLVSINVVTDSSGAEEADETPEVVTSAGISITSTVPVSNPTGVAVAVTTPNVEALASLPEGNYAAVEIWGSVGEQAAKVIENAANSAGVKVAMTLDISLNSMTSNGAPEGKITQLSAPVQFTISAPQGVDAATSDFAIIRVHDGAATLLPDLDDDPSTITFATDRFSAYAVVYGSKGSFKVYKTSGTKDSVPKTGDSFPVAVPMAAAVVVVSATLGAVAMRKRNGECSR